MRRIFLVMFLLFATGVFAQSNPMMFYPSGGAMVNTVGDSLIFYERTDGTDSVLMLVLPSGIYYRVFTSDSAFMTTGAISSTYETIANVGKIGDDTANYQTAYTHSQDNTQAHTDYMLNSGDTVTGNYVVNGVVTADSLGLNADTVSDFTGNGLEVSGTVLQADTATLATKNHAEAYADSIQINDILVGDLNMFGNINQADYINNLDLSNLYAERATSSLSMDPFGNTHDSLIALYDVTWPPAAIDPDTFHSVVHIAKVSFPWRFGGYRDWMFYTPYISNRGSSENPCVQVSNDGINYHYLIDSAGTSPTFDTLMAPLTGFWDHPVQGGGDTADFLSDVDATLHHDGDLVMDYRITYPGERFAVAYMYTHDGWTWIPTGDSLFLLDTTAYLQHLSPSLKPDTSDSWKLWVVERQPDFADDSVGIWEVITNFGQADSIVDTFPTFVLMYESPVLDRDSFSLVNTGRGARLRDSTGTVLLTISDGVVDMPLPDSATRQIWHLRVRDHGRDDYVALQTVSPYQTAGGDSTSLYMATSKDGGGSWSTPVLVMAPEYGSGSDQQDVIYRSDGNWVDDGKGGYMDLLYVGQKTEWKAFHTKVYFQGLDSNNVGAKALATSDINWPVEWIEPTMIYQQESAPQDSVKLQWGVKKWNGTAFNGALFLDSCMGTVAAGDTLYDTVYASFHVPFACTIDTVAFEAAISDSSVITDIEFYQGKRGTRFHSADSSTYNDTTDVTGVTWSSRGVALDAADTLLSRDEYMIAFRIGHHGLGGYVRVANLCFGVTRQ